MRNLLFIIYIISSISAFSQKECNIWYFFNSGLDFNKDTPTVLSVWDSKMRGEYTTASVADSAGKLLFYSNGDTVWNKEHKIMQNGVGIGGKNAIYGSTTLIVRLPQSSRYYYILTMDGQQDIKVFPFTNDGVCYSVVDMLQDGRGRVISKKNLLVKNSAITMAAVLHANQRDVWIGVKQNFSDTLFLFLLTASGWSSQVVKHATFWDSISRGQIKFSPDGKNLAIANARGGIFIYSFNSRSGALSNPRKILTSNGNEGVEFSPNSRYIYFAYNDSARTRYFTQCPLKMITSTFTPDSFIYRIKISKYLRYMQLGPNRKLYSAVSDTFLAVIRHPDRFGADCDFQIKGQKIFVNKPSIGNPLDYGHPIELPSFIASFFRTPAFEVSYNCRSEPAVFKVTDSTELDSVQWDFGDPFSGSANFSNKAPEVSHKYSKYGTYKATMISFSGSVRDTFTQVVIFNDPKVDFEADDVCDRDSVRFINKTLTNNPGYTWAFGDGTSSAIKFPAHLYDTKNISTTFNVTLKVTMENGCVDSIVRPVTVNANPGSDFSFTLLGRTVNFSASQAGNSEYKWLFGDGDSSKGINPGHTYKDNLKTHKVCLQTINVANCSSQTCKEIALGGIHSFRNQSITLYPNPNSGEFEIRVNGTFKKSIIQITDVYGKVLFEQKSEENPIRLDLNFALGIYTLRLFNENGCINQMVQIVK